MKKIASLIGFLLLCIVSNGQLKTVTYKKSVEDFPNPERGFYIPLEGKASQFTPLQADRLKAFRKPQKKGILSLMLANTLVYRGFLLDSFLHAPLSADFLQKIKKDFAAIRVAGMKAIVRFAYTNTTHQGDCPDEYKICPPYGDAQPEIVKQHIRQLAPLLQENADIIAVMQMGFIGIWGENYFTDYFGDASTNGLARVMDSSWIARNEILKALLNALPKDRMVQVRTPQIKQRYVFGASAGVDSPPLTKEAARSESEQARIGFHNDCFLAGTDDYGTFYDYGNSKSPRGPANLPLRKYFMADSKYVAVGGETCDNTFSPQNDCEPLGYAQQEMRSMHYSYLNSAYNMDVIRDWQTGGCIDSIKRCLGYRFVLREVSFPAVAKKGEAFLLSIKLENKGYAAPFNPRTVWLILRNQQTLQEYKLPCKADIRAWYSGGINCEEKMMIPANIPAGKYALLINMPDPYPSLAKRPEYSVRLANEKIWEEKTGYNDLNAVMVVK